MLNKIKLSKYLISVIGLTKSSISNHMVINNDEVIVSEKCCMLSYVNELFNKYGCNIKGTDFSMFNYTVKLVDSSSNQYISITVTDVNDVVKFSTVLYDLDEYRALCSESLIIDKNYITEYLKEVYRLPGHFSRLVEDTDKGFKIVCDGTMRNVRSVIKCFDTFEFESPILDFTIAMFINRADSNLYNLGVVIYESGNPKNIFWKYSIRDIDLTILTSHELPVVEVKEVPVIDVVDIMDKKLQHACICSGVPTFESYNLTDGTLTSKEVIEYFKGLEEQYVHNVLLIKEGVATILYKPLEDKIFNNYEMKTLEQLDAYCNNLPCQADIVYPYEGSTIKVGEFFRIDNPCKDVYKVIYIPHDTNMPGVVYTYETAHEAKHCVDTMFYRFNGTDSKTFKKEAPYFMKIHGLDVYNRIS